MTTGNQTYDGLAVYGTDGEKFYPDSVGGTEYPDVREWFLRTGLRCYLDTRQSEVMVYLGDVRHSSGLDQAFAVYHGPRRESLLSDLAQTVSEDLVEKRGWTIERTTSPSKQKSLFTFLSGEDLRPRRLPQYVEYESELIRRALSADNTAHAVEPLEFIARDYQIAAELVKAYSDVEQVRIHLYDNQDIQPPEEADLVIKVEPGPYEVTVPSETADLLQSLQHRLDSHKAQERKQATIEAIEAHAEQEDDFELVQEAVKEGFERHYRNVVVTPQAERERLETRLEQKQQELQRANADLESLQTDYNRERRQRRRIERKARLTEALKNLTGVIGRSQATEHNRLETDSSTTFDLETRNDSETQWSWKYLILLGAIGLLGIGLGAILLLCPFGGLPIHDVLSSVPVLEDVICSLIILES